MMGILDFLKDHAIARWFSTIPGMPRNRRELLDLAKREGAEGLKRHAQFLEEGLEFHPELDVQTKASIKGEAQVARALAALIEATFVDFTEPEPSQEQEVEVIVDDD